jgi:hypothetical protein
MPERLNEEELADCRLASQSPTHKAD